MSNNLYKELFDFNIDTTKRISVTKNEIYNQLLLYIFLTSKKKFTFSSSNIKRSNWSI